MEKRVFLAIFISFGILAIYQTYVVPPPPAAQGGAATQQPPAENPTLTSPTPPPAPGQELQSGDTTPAAPAPVVLVGATDPHDIVVETNNIHAVFTPEATLKSWRLKHYFDEFGEPLELVPEALPPNYPKPFTLTTDQDALSEVLRAAQFRPSSEGPLALGDSPGTLSFEYQDGSGLTARKIFHFQPDGHPYLITAEASVDVQGVAHPVTLRMGPSLGAGYSTGGRMMAQYPPGAIYYHDGSVERLNTGELEERPIYSGAFKFVGVGDHYFLSAALPESREVSVAFQPVTLPVPEPAATLTGVAERTFVSYSVSTTGSMNLPFYLGPKDFDILKAIDTQLVRSIDFGIFAWLVVPLLQTLKWINGYIGNFGWSIIILTILLNVIMFPLRHRSMVSMRKMQELQPEIKAIQKRYEQYKLTDPERQKMNAETMALYKEKGVNPASGCVPMLLTMPVLFAFYALLAVAIELRGAPFFGWIHDLSKMDPLFITPLLMGISMFIQQKMTPSTADPSQQKIFMVMPVIFTFMFLWAPAGLVIYWLMSNVMTIGQQYLTNHLIGTPAKATTGTSAAKRAKSAGRGATHKARDQQ